MGAECLVRSSVLLIAANFSAHLSVLLRRDDGASCSCLPEGLEGPEHETETQLFLGIPVFSFEV